MKGFFSLVRHICDYYGLDLQEGLKHLTATLGVSNYHLGTTGIHKTTIQLAT